MSMHPQSEAVAAYVEGTLADGERAALEAHLAACPECRAVVTDASLSLRQEARRRRWLVAGPAAGVAAAAAILLLVILPNGDEGIPIPGTTRSGLDPEALPRVEIVHPRMEAPVHPDSVRFAWRSAAPEALYRLAVTDHAGNAVWETTTADTTAEPPRDVRLEPGRRYFWYVDALLPDGSEATTGAREFRVRGP